MSSASGGPTWRVLPAPRINLDGEEEVLLEELDERSCEPSGSDHASEDDACMVVRPAHRRGGGLWHPVAPMMVRDEAVTWKIPALMIWRIGAG